MNTEKEHKQNWTDLVRSEGEQEGLCGELDHHPLPAHPGKLGAGVDHELLQLGGLVDGDQHALWVIHCRYLNIVRIN